MPFADAIIDAVGTTVDRSMFGAVSSLAQKVAESECFAFEDDTKEAMGQLAKSRPSSLVAALPLCRLPYRRCWFEWTGSGIASWTRKDTTDAGPEPRWWGVLLEALDDTHQRIGMTFAWHHWSKDVPSEMRHFVPLSICPLGFVVDWSGDNILPAKMVEKAQIPQLDLPLHERIAVGQLADCMAMAISPVMEPMIEAIKKQPSGKAMSQALIDQGRDDLEGELQMVIAALCLLNSRNCIETDKVQLTKLNKSRAKRQKPPKIEYSTVRIKLSRGDARAAAYEGMTKEEIRQHLVRGHFKIRKTGVYWWRPHIRGNIEAGEIRHEGYQVAQ